MTELSSQYSIFTTRWSLGTACAPGPTAGSCKGFKLWQATADDQHRVYFQGTNTPYSMERSFGNAQFGTKTVAAKLFRPGWYDHMHYLLVKYK